MQVNGNNGVGGIGFTGSGRKPGLSNAADGIPKTIEQKSIIHILGRINDDDEWKEIKVIKIDDGIDKDIYFTYDELDNTLHPGKPLPPDWMDHLYGN